MLKPELYRDLLVRFAESNVRFIVIGGIAGIAHGAARATYDIDFVYDRERQNVDRMTAAMRDFAPCLRGAPPGLPFRFDSPTGFWQD